MIDAFTLFMALTLVVAGLFLCRDHVRFLRSNYSLNGRVVSIQQVFLSSLSGGQQDSQVNYVENGFYPVIEYSLKGQPVRFTAIDPNASGRFHVGEDVRLRMFRSRRKENRQCRTALTLGLMLLLMCLALVLDMAFLELDFSTRSIFVASGVMAICLAILVSYARDCDEQSSRGVTRSQGGKLQLCLFEPAAFQNWSKTTRDPKQRNRIRNKQVFGATCVFSAMFMLALSVS